MKGQQGVPCASHHWACPPFPRGDSPSLWGVLVGGLALPWTDPSPVAYDQAGLKASLDKNSLGAASKTWRHGSGWGQWEELSPLAKPDLGQTSAA